MNTPSEMEREAVKRRLTESLERDRETAYTVAQYQRSHKDDFTARLRFGIFALNGASVVAVLGFLPSTVMAKSLGLDTKGIVFSILCFALGAIFAGGSLVLHQNHLEKVAGDAVGRARSLDEAVLRASADRRSEEYSKLGEVMLAAGKFERATYAVSSFSMAAIWLQSIAGALWVAGVAALLTPALAAALH